MLRRMLRHPFLRSVAVVTSGTAAAQAITLAVTPLLTRLYTPEAIGVLGTFTALVTVAGVVAALRLDLAVVVPAHEPTARSVFLAGMAVVAATTAITALVASAYASGFGASPGAAALAGFAPLAVGATGAFQLAAQWLARHGAFAPLARANVVRTTVASSVQLVGGLVAAGPAALVLGKTAGQVAAAAHALRAALRGAPLMRSTSLSPADAWREVVAHRNFTLFGTIQAFVNSVNQSLPVLLLAALYEPAAVGFYVMANRVLALPIQLVGQSLRQVIYPRLSRDLPLGRARRTARIATLGLAALTVPAMVAVWLVGETAFAWALGPAWATAGIYAGYTVVWLAAAFINIPAVAAIPLLNLQRSHTVFEVVYLAARAAALAGIAASGGSALQAVAWTSWIGAVFNLALIAFVDRAAGRARATGSQEDAPAPDASGDRPGSVTA